MRYFSWIPFLPSPFAKAFLVGLAVPLALLHLVLKTLRVVDRGGVSGLLHVVDLFKSEVLFHAGFTIVGLALLALFGQRRRLQGAIFAGLQALAMAGAALEVMGHRFFLSTGSTLDFYLVTFAFSQLDETFAVISSEVPTRSFVLLGASVVFLLVVPWLLVWLWSRRTQAASAPPGRLTARVGALVVGAALIVLAALPPITEPYVSFARTSFVNMTISMVEMAREYDRGEYGRQPLLDVQFRARRAEAKPKNVVIVVLESTRARSVSVYNDALETTPYLRELAAKSLVADRAYAVVPHTSKALVAILCGIEPRLNMPITESLPDALPARCLADLLSDQGYDTAFFQSAVEAFEGRRRLVENMGYETFTPREEMSTKGFEKANYFGYEDNIMLEPSRLWLAERKGKPFFTTYLTLTPHHDYLAPRRYGRLDFDEDDEVNRYLNTIHYVDNFVRELLEQYKALGLYDDTIFVFVGDHGEGFGEHGRRQHDNVIYEEGIHIPLMIYEPRKSEGVRVAAPISQIDILPTLAEMMGYEITGGDFPGVHMTKAVAGRTVFAHCWYERRCMASVTGTDKFIHHFNRQPDEFFDLAADPLEAESLLESRSDIGLRRLELMTWRSRVIGMYKRHNQGKLEQFVFDKEPPVAHKLDARFGEYVRLVGYSLSHESVRPGERLRITYVFEALADIPADWKLFVHGLGAGRMLNLDHVPVTGLYPLDDWQRGQFVVDVHEVRVPPNWKADELKILMGIYHAEDGRAKVSGTIHVDKDGRAEVVVVPVR
ncbi:MAG: sulfatase-like hydrolase/transferase [Bradymonadaceae bacterium]|nr:sulfatase-like hydrolase/transferase [Lujinxingiaceae bacterium]